MLCLVAVSPRRPLPDLLTPVPVPSAVRALEAALDGLSPPPPAGRPEALAAPERVPGWKLEDDEVLTGRYRHEGKSALSARQARRVLDFLRIQTDPDGPHGEHVLAYTTWRSTQAAGGFSWLLSRLMDPAAPGEPRTTWPTGSAGGAFPPPALPSPLPDHPEVHRTVGPLLDRDPAPADVAGIAERPRAFPCWRSMRASNSRWSCSARQPRPPRHRSAPRPKPDEDAPLPGKDRVRGPSVCSEERSHPVGPGRPTRRCARIVRRRAAQGGGEALAEQQAVRMSLVRDEPQPGLFLVHKGGRVASGQAVVEFDRDFRTVVQHPDRFRSGSLPSHRSGSWPKYRTTSASGVRTGRTSPIRLYFHSPSSRLIVFFFAGVVMPGPRRRLAIAGSFRLQPSTAIAAMSTPAGHFTESPHPGPQGTRPLHDQRE